MPFGDIISQYVSFTKVFDERVKKYGLTVQATRETIRICKDRDVLKEYLSSRESKVADIIITLFSQKEVWDMQVRSIKKKLWSGRPIEEGRSIQRGNVRKDQREV